MAAPLPPTPHVRLAARRGQGAPFQTGARIHALPGDEKRARGRSHIFLHLTESPAHQTIKPFCNRLLTPGTVRDPRRWAGTRALAAAPCIGPALRVSAGRHDASHACLRHQSRPPPRPSGADRRSPGDPRRRLSPDRRLRRAIRVRDRDRKDRSRVGAARATRPWRPRLHGQPHLGLVRLPRRRRGARAVPGGRCLPGRGHRAMSGRRHLDSKEHRGGEAGKIRLRRIPDTAGRRHRRHAFGPRAAPDAFAPCR